MSPAQVTRDSRTYSLGVCTAAAGPDEGGCKDGGVCLLSGSKGVSFGRLASMRLDYRHQDGAVVLSYANGDSCPPGKPRSGAMFTLLVNTKPDLAVGETDAPNPGCRDLGLDHGRHVLTAWEHTVGRPGGPEGGLG